MGDVDGDALEGEDGEEEDQSDPDGEIDDEHWNEESGATGDQQWGSGSWQDGSSWGEDDWSGSGGGGQQHGPGGGGQQHQTQHQFVKQQWRMAQKQKKGLPSSSTHRSEWADFCRQIKSGECDPGTHSKIKGKKEKRAFFKVFLDSGKDRGETHNCSKSS